MILRRAKSTVGVLVLGFALAATPIVVIGPAAATKHKTTHHPKHKTTHATTGISTGSCTAVTKEETQASGLASGLEKAFASGNFTAIKAAILSEFSELSTDVSKAESFLSGAPANVKTAFANIAHAYSGLKSQIAATTSLQQLETVFTSLGSNQQVVAAGKVLESYFGTKCGVTTPTT